MRHFFTLTLSVLLSLVMVQAQNKYFRPVIIDHNKVANTDQSNFPVLISGTYPFLKTTGNGGKVSNINGHDIVFTEDSQGLTRLTWDIERYDPATGEIIVWVKTNLSASTDKVIYMHYGDPAITTFQGNKAGTWNNSYTSVYHFGSGTAINATDATSNAINGTNNGSAASAGKVYGAAAFNGSSNHITLGTGSNIGITGDITIQAWVNPSDYANFNGILSKTNGNQPAPYDFYLTAGSGIPNFFRGNGSGANANISGSAAPQAGVWSHLVVTVTGNTVRHYLNGMLNGSGNLNVSGVGVNGSSNAYIGTRGDFATRFKGSMDEVRVSNVARSADWIRTEYNNQSAPAAFYTFGTEEISGNQSPVANAGTNQTIKLPASSVTLNGSGTDTDGTITGYNWTVESGPGSPVIVSPSSASTNVIGLAEGSYVFRLTVTDDMGSSGSATVTVTVQPANYAPVANAGANQSITLPASSVVLNGSGTDQDGTITSYSWTRISGPNTPTIVSPSSAGTNVTGLVQGSYVFRLTVTDNAGATGTSDVTVLVNAPLIAGKYFREITIDRTKVVSTPQSNFPVLISGVYDFLKTLPNGGKVANANGYDILFTADSLGETKLNWEIERYNPATGEIVAWVKMDISPSQDKVVYLQYGDPGITTFQGNTGGTWNNGYASVYHLGNGSSLNAVDASGSNNGTVNGATASAGRISGAAAFNGSSNHITLGTGSNIGITGDITIQAWVNPSDYANFNGILSKTNGNQPAPYDFYLTAGSGIPNFFRGNGSGANANISGSAAPQAGVWSHLVVTVTGNTVRHYLNGVLNGSGNLNVSGVGVNGSSNAYIGTRGDFATRFKGSMDEVRVSNVARSADWIRTEYNNQSAPAAFYSIGVEKGGGNQPPAASAGPNQTITLPQASVTLEGSGSSPTGFIAAYQWSLVSGPNTPQITTPSESTTTVTGLVAGEYIFRLTVTDNNDETATSDVTITVEAPNQPPVANAGSNQSIMLPAVSSVTLNGSGTDTDGTVTTYLWTKISGPETYNIANPGSASTLVSGLVEGVYVFQLTVTDDDGDSGTSQVTITVTTLNSPNTPPVAVAGPDISVTLPVSTVALDASGSSDDRNIVAYHWEQIAGPVAGIFSAPDAMTTNFSNLAEGTYVVVLTVTDDSTATGKDTINIVVHPPLNQPPVAKAGADQVITLPVNSVSLDASASTDDRNIVSYQWIKLSGSGGTFSTPNAATTTFNGLAAGTYEIELRVTDDSSAVSRDTVVITVNRALNQPPVAVAGPDRSITLPVNSVGLDASASTDDYAIVSYQWIKLSGNGGTFTAPGSAITNFNGLTAGVYTVELRVTDDSTVVSKDTVTITVYPPLNQPPVARAGDDQTIYAPATSVTLNGSASTDDYSIASYLWTKLTGAGGNITNPTAAVTTFTGLSAGVYTVELRVTDDSSVVARDTIRITVSAQPPNTPPVANAGNDQSINAPMSNATLDASGSTDDNGIVAYLWTKLSGTGGTIASPASAVTNFSGLSVGSYQVELRVTDADGAFSRDTMNIIVKTASVLDPTDVVVTYNGTLPAEPPFGQIGKWVRRNRNLGWNTDSYKAYIYKGVVFRLKFPKTYNPAANDGKRYPMMLFFHGLGEAAGITDNEYQLYHGGNVFNNAVNNGTFDGYVLFMQSQGFWGTGHYVYLKEIIDYMIENNKLDRFHIVDNGLSAGGQGTWEMFLNYPTYISASIPMANVNVGYKDNPYRDLLKFQPVWNVHGYQDGSPAPNTAEQVRDAILGVGGNYRNTMYMDLGHGVWDRTWTEPDFWPFVNRWYASNPWTLFGRTEFCPGDPINVTIGLKPGFDAYEWRKNGVRIAGATSNTIQVTEVGVYDVRILKGGTWSEWSRNPVEIKIKAPTVSPDITVSGLMSRAIPAVDSAHVVLSVPDNYTSYIWQKVGSSTTLSTTNTLKVTTPGDYVIKVTEQYGCSSSFSEPFTVVNAGGENKPSVAGNLVVSTLSKTSLRLDWTDNPAAQYNETNYEIYQSLTSGGGYKIVAITGADVTTYTAEHLNPNTRYYYVVRAVNDMAASAVSNEASGVTSSDTQAPTSPANLVITGRNNSSVVLSWNSSTDDVGIQYYDVYVNGQKSYVTTDTVFTVTPLETKVSYTFYVKARDLAGNNSPASNQVSGQPLFSGLAYKYYTGDWNTLPDFNALTPVKSGYVSNVTLEPKTQDDYYGFLWEGYIRIPVSGTYRFRTSSDDGSKLYLGTLNSQTPAYSHSATAIVNNDGLHGMTAVTSSARTLSAGVYPIAVTFFEKTGGDDIAVSWNTPQTSGNYVTIPNSAFEDAPANNGQAPAAPSALTAQANGNSRINLAWVDNSTNETGFEIWRSVNATTGFATVGTAGANTTSFVDSLNIMPATTYYYKIRAIGQYGESELVDNISLALWQLNNNYNDATGNGRTLTATGNPAFDASDKKEGTHALNISNGSSRYLTIPSAFVQTAFPARTVAFWMKSATNSGSNKVIFDLGGNDNGLALLIGSNTLIAAVASNSTRHNISAAYSYSTSTWNHIAVVYRGNTLRLFINGVQVAANTNLSFSSVGTTTNGSRIATVNGNNAYNSGTGYFNGRIDNFGIYGSELTQAQIADLMNNQQPLQSFAVTGAPTPVPAAPSALQTVSNQPNTIDVNWVDNASNETGIELYRSSNNNSNYLLLATLPANTTSYHDTALFSHAVYYYKVRAAGSGGNSAFSNESNATVKNNKPVIAAIAGRSIRYGTTSTMEVSGSDADTDPLTFTLVNAPAFASVTGNSAATAVLTFNPLVAQAGTYNGIGVIADDGYGGKDTAYFDLVVNDNYDPVLTAISNVVISEGASTVINLSATDQNAGDILTWSVGNMPGFHVLTPGANGSATLQLQPGYAASGQYQVQVTVADGNGGSATRQFTITVTEKDPNQKIYVGFDTPAGQPWNSLTTSSASNLRDSYNNTTSVGLNIQTSSWIVGYLGPQTGNNSGVYPDDVLRSFHYFGLPWQPQTVTGVINGLETSKKYTITFYAGSTWDVAADNGSTNYTIGSQTVSLYVQNNTQNTVSITNITPQADGTITFTMAKGAGATVGYLNALVISSTYDDGSAPAAPASLTSGYAFGEGVKLNWTDRAYNETGFEIYRSTSVEGTYVLAGTINKADATTFTDGAAQGNQQYFYKVRAVNDYGTSPYSETVSILTPNRVPQIAAIANVVLKNNESVAVNVTAVDDAADHITLTATGLPPFATFTDNGNGTGVINIVPSSGAIGYYPGIKITASDNLDSARSAMFDITVVDKDISSVYINFSDGVFTGKRPWNNFSQWPLAGSAMSGLLDDGNANSGMNITILDNMDILNRGMIPGNGETIYPDSVMRTSLYDQSTSTKRIRLSGLSTSRRYNVVFFASHDFGLKCLTNFTINGTTVSLDATYNMNKTVQINGIVPNASGEIVINIAKAAGNDLAILTSLVVQSYASSVTLLSPTDLRVTGIASNSLKLQWADRASDETGFQVWRATDTLNSSFALVATLAANATSYTDNNLKANRTYYYTVRAVKSGQFSAYCNMAQATTYASNVYINFTGVNDVGSPWNNTHAAPVAGALWSGFKNEAGQTTSTGMEIIDAFSEVHPLGMVTGNNSGYYPDDLLMYSYYVFPGITAKVKVKGLNVAHRYDFTFVGSSAGFGDLRSAYIINGKTYYLNAALNLGYGRLVVHDIQPDENGEVEISIHRGSSQSPGGYLNAMIISGVSKPAFATPVLPGSAPQSMGMPSAMPGQDTAATAGRRSAEVAAANTQEITIEKGYINAYPNPFYNAFNVVFDAEDGERAVITVFNQAGQNVYLNNVAGTVGGRNQVRIQPGNGMSKPGTYIVRVELLGRDNKMRVKTLKLVKL